MILLAGKLVTKTRIITATALAGATLLIPVALRGDRSEQKAPAAIVVEVQTAGMRYNDGPLETRELVNCSAVILDFGKSAIMAHALPLEKRGDWIVDGDKGITTGNVVDYLLKDAKLRGLDYRKGHAIVNAGSDEALAFIVKDLRAAGITIAEANTKLAPGSNGISRMVGYDPKSKKLDVEYDIDVLF